MQEKVITIPASVQERPILRVAAYCRVSSDSGDQLHSFAAQVQHYTHFISNNERMELVDIYADEGISGTKTAKREDFNRLVADCKKGKIDRVLTKSVSRFARNTADSLLYARLLKDHGVSILFEKENIDTAYMSSEMLLALSGAQAQEESISISKNMRWSIERRMKNGTFIPSTTPYGYVLKDREFHIVEQEAEIVRLIFMSYLSGMGKKAIADMLNEMNAPKRLGYDTWRINTVDYILSNERYNGKLVTLLGDFKKLNIPCLLTNDQVQALEKMKRQNNRLSSEISYEGIAKLAGQNNHFKNALAMYHSSFSVSDYKVGFVLLITALEALVSLSTYPKVEQCKTCNQKLYTIRKSVSENVGTILLDKDGTICGRMKKLYDKRSKFLHEGIQDISVQEEQEMQEYVRKVLLMYWCVSMCKGTYLHKDIMDEIKGEGYKECILYQNFLTMFENTTFEEKKNKMLRDALIRVLCHNKLSDAEPSAE